MDGIKDFENLSPEWQQDFLQLAELYKGLTADQQKQLLKELTKIRLDEMINKGMELLNNPTVEDMTPAMLGVLNELSGYERPAFTYNAFLIGLAAGYEAGKEEA